MCREEEIEQACDEGGVVAAGPLAVDLVAARCIAEGGSAAVGCWALEERRTSERFQQRWISPGLRRETIAAAAAGVVAAAVGGEVSRGVVVARNSSW